MRLRDLLSTSTGSQFKRNFLKVARANIVAMALPIAATPLLTRLFSPGDFGALAIFTSVLSLLVAFATWRFDWSLPNAKSMTLAASLVALCVASLLLTSLLLSLGIWFGGRLLLETPLDDLGHALYLLPVALIGIGLRETFSGWFVRYGDLTAVSRATIVQSITNVAASVAAGALSLGTPGLIGASILATWTGIVLLLRQSRDNLLLHMARVSPASLRLAISRHGRNATWSTLVSIVNTVSTNAPIITLAYFYIPHEVGWYALMNRLVAAPAGVLASALGQSFWSQAAGYARSGQIAELNRFYLRTTARLGLACIPVIALCLSGPLFVGPILGAEEWGGAGYVMLVMTPLFVGWLMFSPTNHLVVLDKQHLQLLVDTTRFVLVVGSITIGSYIGLDFITVVALSSLSSFAGHAMLFLIHLMVHRYEQR